MNKSKKNSSIINNGIIILACVLVVIYLGTAIYCKNHFYLGSKINGINVSGMTVEEVDNLLASKFQSYSLTLEERNDLTETISADDISLTYSAESKIQDFKDNQSSLGWIIGMFKNKTTELTDLINYNDSKLEEILNNLQGVKSDKIVLPKSASVKFNDGNLEVTEEVQGNQINMDTLRSLVKQSITDSNETLNLNDSDCYEKPKYVSTDSEVQNAKEELQKCASSVITYTFGEDGEETLDKNTISNWLTTDEELQVQLDESAVKKYVLSLANKYNTASKYRSFKTSGGSVINIEPGDYGWRIDISTETQDLINNIKDGQSTTKEPAYVQKASQRGANDIGSTYVEVNLSTQHLWYYKNGSLVTEGNVVTGNVSAGTGTPAGVYMLKYKEKNATLKGENYATPVGFWMPFNGGIGLHDAYWRDNFGGSEYLYNGSHGCVNCPPTLAEEIFNNIESGTAVVLY